MLILDSEWADRFDIQRAYRPYVEWPARPNVQRTRCPKFKRALQLDAKYGQIVSGEEFPILGFMPFLQKGFRKNIRAYTDAKDNKPTWGYAQKHGHSSRSNDSETLHCGISHSSLILRGKAVAGYILIGGSTSLNSKNQYGCCRPFPVGHDQSTIREHQARAYAFTVGSGDSAASLEVLELVKVPPNPATLGINHQLLVQTGGLVQFFSDAGGL